MNSEQIITACAAIEEKFSSILAGEEYQIRGAFNSEVLLIVALAEHYGVKHIIESGRARGHSTNLLAKYFKNTDVRITSIDFDKNSEDAKYSERVLATYPNVEVVYGDANKIAPASISEDCVVFIDGPKGDEAIELGVRLLENKHVKVICLHDFHKNHFLRNVCDLIFSDHFYTDNKKFVERFSYLDDNCWKTLKGKNYAPYYKYGKKSDSYAATLAAFFNSECPTVQPALNNYRTFKAANQPSLGKWITSYLAHDSLLYKMILKLNQISKKK